MPIFTPEQLDAQIEAYQSALLKLATAKQYTHNGRVFLREDLPEVRETLIWLQSEKDKMLGSSAASGRTYARPGRPR